MADSVRGGGPSGPPGRLVVDVVAGGGVRTPGLAAWLASVAPARARGCVTVAVVPDARVRALNRQYRRKDEATDVLSFPAFARGHRRGGPSNERGHLGEIVIAAGVARRQARAAGHSLQTELRVLALHGLLHLLGYDHERDEGRMARLEARLRRRGGLREGLIARARTA
ncbi:MAG: rRNA maturation RNase YbeY [Acidobacteria bacterium]|nr:rRNA maturation RNase YbeY [Acidobacteriota bacterium]